ncbi:MAG: alpha-ribazole phosphatase family protein [Psychromonas sp.]
MSTSNGDNFPIAHNIYLIRHGEVGVASDICYGQLDCALTESYQSDLNRLCDYFQRHQIAKADYRIISSPLTRCLSLASGLQQWLKPLAIPLTIESNFQEIHFGGWEGKTWQVIGKQAIDDWNDNLLDFQFPEGESTRQFDQRVLKAWDHLTEQLSEATEVQNIVLISHAGVIRSILAHFLKMPLAHALTLKIDKLSVSTLRVVAQQNQLSQCTAINHIL